MVIIIIIIIMKMLIKTVMMSAYTSKLQIHEDSEHAHNVIIATIFPLELFNAVTKKGRMLNVTSSG
jgi:hypothetical protein